MRSTFALAAFAAGAVAIPYEKRDYFTKVDIVYQTDIVTVYATEGQAPAATPAAPAASDSDSRPGQHWGHGGNHWSNTWTAEAPSSTYVAPAETSSVYVAPTTSEYVAPATTEAPAPTSEYVAPTTPAWSAPAAPSSSAPSYAAPASNDYSGIAVNQHNLHRANHSSPDLAWDEGLAKSAADIAASCVYAHNTEMDGGGYGQNIAAGVEPKDIATIITDLFYNGEVNYYSGMYGQAQPDMTDFEKWGHFSQIVWADTTHVGCATQHCPGGLGNVGSDVAPYFTVCNYKNPGNYANEYGKNIGAPLNQPTVQGNAVIAVNV